MSFTIKRILKSNFCWKSRRDGLKSKRKWFFSQTMTFYRFLLFKIEGAKRVRMTEKFVEVEEQLYIAYSEHTIWADTFFFVNWYGLMINFEIDMKKEKIWNEIAAKIIFLRSLHRLCIRYMIYLSFLYATHFHNTILSSAFNFSWKG